METVVITALIGAFVCGGVFLETLAPHLPALLGLDGRVGPAKPGLSSALSGAETTYAARIGAPRTASPTRGFDEASALADVERRLDEVEAERDFYRALVEARPGSAVASPDGRSS